MIRSSLFGRFMPILTIFGIEVTKEFYVLQIPFKFDATLVQIKNMDYPTLFLNLFELCLATRSCLSNIFSKLIFVIRTAG